MLGNGVVGILSESVNKWERRAPLTPSHCARLLHSGKDKTGVARIIVQPSTKRIHHDAMYEDVGCEISDDLSECGLIVGIKQPKLDMILHDRAYAFFSHTHKAQKENMPLLDKVLAQRVSLYDYELIVGDHGKRLLAFGKFAGRAGFIDFLSGLGKRYLSLGYSTPFLSLGEAYMYSSLAAAKAAVISVGEEIATFGLPSGICPLVFIFTGSGNGNVSHGAQEIFKLLPHTFVDPSRLPELFAQGRDLIPPEKASKRVFQVYGCVVTCQGMVEHQDSSKTFDKTDYYAHPEHYKPIFHEKIAPYASVIVNCMYWEKRFPRLLSTQQLQDLTRRGCPLIGIADITCDIEGSLEFINQTTSIDSPFVRYDPLNDSYHHDMEGDGVIFSSVDILPTQFAKEASQHFGDILSQFIGSLASTTDITKLPSHLRKACIAHGGALTPLFEYIPRMRKSDSEEIAESPTNLKSSKNKFSILVEVVVSLLPPSCHIIIANACIKLKKHLVTASYVDDSMSFLHEEAKAADITILGEMGLDPGIDHMMAMKMINNVRVRKGRIKSFTSYCGGLPSPAAANNPLAYKFSWSPAGAIRSGRNPATYKNHGEIVHVDGEKLYDSAFRFRLPNFPAFALECLPNRNSLVYGKLYGIEDEASTIFRGTLRYEGFGEIMGTIASIGLFNTESHPVLRHGQRPSFKRFLCELLNIVSEIPDGVPLGEKHISERIVALGHCKEQGTAVRTAKTIIYLGLHERTEIPVSCQSAFDVTCYRMEERLAYSSTEQDMVLLHHEMEVEFPDSQATENHKGTLLEFGRTGNGKTTTAMALTVGIPVAIGALLLLENKINTRGVLRPFEPEVYVPALDILQAYGIKVMEKVE